MRRKGQNFWAALAIFSGIVIFLSLILPIEFWWFVLAVSLVCLGVWCLRRCV